MSAKTRVTRPPATNPHTELEKWLSRPGLVEDLRRLVRAEPEVIAVLMAACSRHPAPITDPSPIPTATPFTVVFLEQVTEAIQQGIPDEYPGAGVRVDGRKHADRSGGDTRRSASRVPRERVEWNPEPRAQDQAAAASYRPAFAFDPQHPDAHADPPGGKVPLQG